MLAHLCVAYDPSPPGRWALQHAVVLARRARARLTVAHVVAATDEGLDEPPSILDELLPVRDDVRCRQRLVAMLAPLTAGVDMHIRVLTGPARSTLLDLVRAERPDLVVAGATARRGVRRLLAAALSDTLLAEAPCPVALVRTRPHEAQPIVLALADRRAGEDAALRHARELAGDLEASILEHPAPRHARDRRGMLAAVAACRRHGPLLTVLGGELLPAARRRLGCSLADALGDVTSSPIAVVPPRLSPGRAAPTYRVRDASRPRAHHGLHASAHRSHAAR